MLLGINIVSGDKQKADLVQLLQNVLAGDENAIARYEAMINSKDEGVNEDFLSYGHQSAKEGPQSKVGEGNDGTVGGEKGDVTSRALAELFKIQGRSAAEFLVKCIEDTETPGAVQNESFSKIKEALASLTDTSIEDLREELSDAKNHGFDPANYLGTVLLERAISKEIGGKYIKKA